MAHLARSLLLALLCASGAASDSRHDHNHDHNHEDHHARGGGTGAGAEAVAVQVDASMKHLVTRLLGRRGTPPSSTEMMKAGMGKVDVHIAAKRVEEKLPASMASLVKTAVEGKAKAQQPFDESSLSKALKYLNFLVEGAWKELDSKLIDCKEFEDKNRGTFDQTVTDIARLSEQIADHERIKSESVEMINVREMEIMQVQADLKKETDIYMKIYLENKQEMTIRQNDMAVFQFMLQLVKCKSSAFVQVDGYREARICDSSEGLVLSFGDKKAEAAIERKMTPAARRALSEVLSNVEAERGRDAADHIQGAARQAVRDDDDFSDSGSSDEAVLISLGVNATTTATTTTPGLPTPAVPKVKVQKGVPVAEGHFKCPRGPPDCGLLHDKMSLMWGKFKDLVDELQHEMDKNAFVFEQMKADFNQQLEVMRNSKAKFIQELAEATANLNADREEAGEKEEQRVRLQGEYRVFMAECRKRIEWIMFQDICSYLTVRATLMTHSKVSPPAKIFDCGVSAWIPGECSVPCDDECPVKNNPNGCGGWQKLNREIVVAPNEFGLKCPYLTLKRKCNQIKCPVDCVMSQWSRFGKCSKECEGGTKGRTRSIIVKPMNGGMSCNVVAESRPCNTGSCDRNCRLKKWSQWTPCSVACGGGFQERYRRITVPVRGNGKCPKPSSKIRYGIQKCNVHECVGDEVCVAKQDLVLAIDGSGSLRASGFEILKGFSASLIERYKGEYYGYEDMKIGVVQFGNGEILPDGSIQDAKEIIGLTKDMGKVKAAIQEMSFLKGFTNMAQAFTKVEKLILLDGRPKAQSAVLTLTDGKPSFLFQTNEKVMQLKDKHIKLFFAPVTEFKGEEMLLMKKWASSPWETNLVHIPGLLALKADEPVFAQKALVKFCPEAFSPSAMMTEEKSMGYMLIREEGTCGDRGPLLGKDVLGAADCAALAEGAGFTAFSLGVRYARGTCYAETLQVTAEMITEFNKDRANPPCGPGWKDDALYDFYAIEPTAEV